MIFTIYVSNSIIKDKYKFIILCGKNNIYYIILKFKIQICQF